MNNKHQFPGRLFAIGIMIIVPIVGMGIYFFTRSGVAIPGSESDAVDSTVGNQLVSVGGVTRPASDLAGRWVDEDALDPGYKILSDTTLFYGDVPQTARDANPTVAAVYKAVEQGLNPEQLSPMVAPKAFDRDSFLANPDAYLVQHVPGRVWQTAQPGPGIPVLERIGPPKQVMKFGEAIRLKVKTEPGMPVTFTSFDIGTFDNGLASITVAADDKGFAEANFNSSSGKVGEVNLLAASPVATEQVKFDVYVAPPSKNNP